MPWEPAATFTETTYPQWLWFKLEKSIKIGSYMMWGDPDVLDPYMATPTELGSPQSWELFATNDVHDESTAGAANWVQLDQRSGVGMTTTSAWTPKMSKTYKIDPAQIPNMPMPNVTTLVAPTTAGGTGVLSGTLTRTTNNEGAAIFDDISYDVAEKIEFQAHILQPYKLDDLTGNQCPVLNDPIVTFQTDCTSKINVCPNRICRIETLEAPATCTLDIPTEDPIVIRATDNAGNLLLPHQTEQCSAHLSVSLDRTMRTPVTGQFATPKWHRVPP
jgi:hypothetical protein